MVLDTIFDLGMLVVDAKRFHSEPTWENFAYVTISAVSVALPGVPNIKGGYQLVEKLMKKSPHLRAALQKVVYGYYDMTKITPPSLTAPGGSWQRHYIIGGKFAPQFNTTYNNMPCIFTPYEWHKKISAKQYSMPTTLTARQAAFEHLSAYQNLANAATTDTEKAFWQWCYNWTGTFIEKELGNYTHAPLG